ncbi:MAG: ABC transporter ATP-binding protein, partial [Ruminococcaceae bacterium]|nr:ABC transporter ATP-binding protein [Oscillospiraceae bacterium]
MAENRHVTLKLEGVSKSFAKVEADEVTHALDNVSVTMESGEFISLVGPSGCGKSTILRLVTALIPPTAGKVTVNGEEVTEPSPNRGMVFQKPTLFPWLTVEKNIGFSLQVQGKLKENQHKVDRMLKVIGLESFRNDYPAQLSGGMAQRVALARTLLSEPETLTLDEPLGALDAFTRMNMQDEILDIWKERKQLALMVTHDVDEAIYMGTRVLVM